MPQEAENAKAEKQAENATCKQRNHYNMPGTNHCDHEDACKGISASVIGQTKIFELAQWPVANVFHNGMVFMTCTIGMWI